ncbi:MAG: DedA family protein [Pseudomonadales bacterium]|nr:DedA family protein [Pseudomonadales bacterium]
MADSSLEIWGLFFSALISSTLLPGGSELVLGYLLTSDRFPTGLLVAIATLGNSLGAMLTWLMGFLIATRFGSDRVANRLSAKAIDSVQSWGAVVLLFSWVPLLGDGLCLAAGWLRLGAWRCLTAIVIGKAGRYAVIAYVLAP